LTAAWSSFPARRSASTGAATLGISYATDESELREALDVMADAYEAAAK